MLHPCHQAERKLIKQQKVWGWEKEEGKKTKKAVLAEGVKCAKITDLLAAGKEILMNLDSGDVIYKVAEKI